MTVAETRLVEALAKPLILASRHGFEGLDGIPELGPRLRAACDALVASGALPAERVGPFKMYRVGLARFEKLARTEREVAIARGLRLVAAIGGRLDLKVDDEPKVKAAAPAGPVVPVSPLDAPTSTLPGLGPTLSARLAERGIETVEDLAWLVPRGYDDLRDAVPLAAAIARCEAEDPARVTFVATVRRVRFARFRRRFLEVGLDGGGSAGSADGARVVARWFNVHGGMAARFVVGKDVVLSGKLRRRNDAWEVANPDVLGEPGDAAAARATLRPRYADIEGVPGALVRKAAAAAIQRVAPLLVDGVPPAIAGRQGLASLREALLGLHAPPADLDPAATATLLAGESEWHRRLAFDELFVLALAVAKRRAARRTDHAHPCVAPGALDAVRAALPFALTGAQTRAIEQVTADLAKPEPMNRLLQGDVGSGKTAVALGAAHVALAAGRQVALMAPTELLAEQHYRTLAPLARKLGHEIALLTASTPRGVRESTLRLVEAGQLGFLVGTHALLAERVGFSDLGLVLIDEQHRFGVGQRLTLRSKGEAGDGAPHLLVMTATPIPRTLALTVYGDLDVSVLDELPPGRTPIETRLHTGSKARATAIATVKKALKAGARVFWVCPLVEPSVEEMDGPVWSDATSTHAALSAALAPARVGLVHGRIPGAERDAQMAALRDGGLDVLVATTVIEVGVDVPAARLMVIEDAERFGLAQLHQLRGRVGRAPGRAVCLLLARSSKTEEASRRLGVMVETTDGFRIAEEDLAIRGPGELMGARQAGLPKLRFGDLQRHAELLLAARDEAHALLADDPTLERHPATRTVLEARTGGSATFGPESG